MHKHKNRLTAIIGLLFVAALFTCNLQAQAPSGGGPNVQTGSVLIPLTPEDKSANLRLQTKRVINQAFNSNQQQYRQLQQILEQPNAEQQLGTELFNLVKGIAAQLKTALNQAKPGTIPD